MNALYLSIIVLTMSVTGVSRKEYDRRHSFGTFTFSACTIIFALLFFVFGLNGKFGAMDPVSLWCSIGFAITFALANVSAFFAVQTGPLSLTALFTSYSLLIPTMYGLIALGEKITLLLVVGILLLIVSIFLSNYEKKGDQKKITLKWVIYVLLNFFSNGGCTTIQRIQQDMSGGLYKNEFMIVALGIATVCLFTVALFTERKDIVPCVKKGVPFYAICGISTGVLNLLVMVLSGTMNASIMFPVISGGSIILSTAVSLFVYKEKLNKIQIVGVCVGILSVVCLNI